VGFNRHGAQGLLDGASKGLLESEFGTSNEDDVMVKILERGEYQTSVVCSPLLSRGSIRVNANVLVELRAPS